jgi:hypothetical protein
MQQNFITTEQLQSIAAISDSVETKFLIPFISTAQAMTTELILGIALSTEISNQLISGTTSTANQLLINDYILPQLAYATWSQASPFLGIKAYKKSLVKPVDPNSEALTLDEMRFYKANIDNMSNFYKERLYKFLEDDAQLATPVYPLYRSTADNEFRSTGSPTSGFYMKTKRF